MAISNDYTDYKPVYSGEVPPHQENELPNEVPASAFRYSKELIFRVDLSSVLLEEGVGISSQDLDGYWEFELRDTPDGAAFFKQKVRWKARVTVLLDVFTGLLGLVTWSPLGFSSADSPSGVEIMPGGGLIETTIINGEAVDPADGWQYVDDTIPTRFSNQGYTLFDPVGVAVVGYAEFNATWFSPPFKVNIPSPAFLKRTADQWPAGSIASGSFAFSFKAAQGQIDATFNDFTALLHAYTWNGNAFISQGYSDYTHLERRAFVGNASEASVNEDKYGRVWLLVKEGLVWNEYVSFDGGRTLSKHAQVWEQGVQMARSLIRDDGVRISMAVDGKELLYRTSADDYAGVTKIATLLQAQPFTPAIDKSGKQYAVGENGVVFVSSTGGRTWIKRGQTAAEIAQENQRITAAANGVIIVSNE